MSTRAPCQVCGKPLDNLYCTSNTCEACCKAGKCPVRLDCLPYYEFMQKELNRQRALIDFNPSSRKGWS